MKKAIHLIVSVVLVSSCVPSSKYNSLAVENADLKIQIDSLKANLEQTLSELEHYKYAPDALYAEAKTYIDDKDRDNLARVCDELKKYHPQSQEYSKVKTALEKLDKSIADKKKAEEAAETARIAAEKAKRMKAVTKLKKQFDDVSGITWYKNPYFTHYNDENRTSIYIGKRETGKPWLRLKMSYYGDDWIFFEEAYLSYDGNTKQISFDRYRDRESNNSGGKVWEWMDVSVDESTLSFLKKMVEGKTVKMRLSGKYTHTKTLNKTEVNAIRDVLLAYDVLLNGE